MIDIFEATIKPYFGIGELKLGMSLEAIRSLLKASIIPFDQTINPNKGCTPEVPWTYIKISNSITLCFAKDILWSIVLENDYKGNTENGLYIGMKMSDAKQADSTLEYNEDDEDFISQNGYWINDDVESGLITAITIFIPEAGDSDRFFAYNWVEKYESGNDSKR